MTQLDAGPYLEQFRKEMLRRGGAWRCVHDLARLLLCQPEQLRHRLCWKRRRCHQQEWIVCNERDRCKVLVRIEWRCPVERRCDRERASTEHERVAVRSGPGERLDTEHGACARAVLEADRRA